MLLYPPMDSEYLKVHMFLHLLQNSGLFASSSTTAVIESIWNRRVGFSSSLRVYSVVLWIHMYIFMDWFLNLCLCLFILISLLLYLDLFAVSSQFTWLGCTCSLLILSLVSYNIENRHWQIHTCYYLCLGYNILLVNQSCSFANDTLQASCRNSHITGAR